MPYDPVLRDRLLVPTDRLAARLGARGLRVVGQPRRDARLTC